MRLSSWTADEDKQQRTKRTKNRGGEEAMEQPTLVRAVFFGDAEDEDEDEDEGARSSRRGCWDGSDY
jgi:hypothetical protein